MDRHFLVVWEFFVRLGAEAEFECAYGSSGAWVRLFAGHPGYLGTELSQDLEQPRRYFTFDRWVSRAAYGTFRAACAAEYMAVDRQGEGLTERETEIGRFEIVDRG